MAHELHLLDESRCFAGIGDDTVTRDETLIRLQDIHFSSLNHHTEEPPWALPEQSILIFLSLVNIDDVPLHMIAGPAAEVTIGPLHAFDTKRWFQSILCPNLRTNFRAANEPWLQSEQTNSTLGILAGLEVYPKPFKGSSGPRVTEILFFASKDLPQGNGSSNDHPASLAMKLFALPLSSDLLHRNPPDDSSPPASPKGSNPSAEATFLPKRWAQPGTDSSVINQPPVRKRKNTDQAFEEASERQRKARKKGGESVAAAAAPLVKRDNSIPTLQHRRSKSNSQPVPLQTRPLSRSPSVASMRPTSAREGSVPAISRRSTLSRVQSVPAVPVAQETSVEGKNKDLVSKIVMAGMRLYGLAQSKSRKSRANSAAASPAAGDDKSEAVEADRRNDDEFKAIYHQLFKGTCFAFRQHFTSIHLQTRAEAVRETVDRLLAIFCTNPLAFANDAVDDSITPGGRKIFGSAQKEAADGCNPFVQFLAPRK